MRVLELANKEIHERRLTCARSFRKQDFKTSTKEFIGSSGEIRTILNKDNDDTLVIVEQNPHQTPLKNGGAVDTSTAVLREFMSRPCHRKSGRNLGLVILSHPEQTWVNQETQSPYAFKFKKIDKVDEENRHHMMMKDSKEDSKLVLASQRQENTEVQIAAILDHFSQIIKSQSN